MYNNKDNESADKNLIAKIPPLPEGKTKHFFISYNSLDRERVFSVVNELEERFKLGCVYDERDFQGGKDISVNILEGIKSSWKILIFLTPNFLQSGWCKYETDAAFVTSMGCGYSCIVPVVLEECEIPPTLVTLTYIDTTIPGVDASSKIASSLLRPESDDGLFPLNVRAFNKIFENGYCYIIPAKRQNLCAYRPAKYCFSLEENLSEKLKENKVEVPEDLLADAIDILNKDSVMWSFDFLNRCRNFCWSLILLPLYFIIFGLAESSTVLGTATRDKQSKYGNTYLIYPLLYLLMPVSFVIIQISLCCLPNICHRKKRDVSLQTRLWRKVGKRCIENNTLLLFTSRRNQLPTEYFVGLVKSRNIVPVDRAITPEVYADILIERHLSEIANILVDDFDFLPDAPYNRHNVKKGKMCICQQLENNL